LSWAKADDPERCKRIAAARRGKPRPPHVEEAVARAHRGTRHTGEARRKMSETRKRIGQLVPGTAPWTAEEDRAVRELPPPEAVRRTGRTPTAVYSRRGALGLLDGRAGREIPTRRKRRS
jgi:hypothetical protein